jgi:hypothetical protein
MSAKDLTVYIGYDSKEPAAAAVLAHSILTRASSPVYFMPLTKKAVEKFYTRTRGPLEATEFSMSRFLVPYLSGYEGWSLFLDCDMLCLSDIWELMLYPIVDPGKAVYVCKHDYTPKDAVKFLGQKQTAYPRKNWSSLMLFDNNQCRALTPDYVNTATGLELHRFHWTNDEAIGSLPLEWNHLVGEENQVSPAKIYHYTNGTPCFDAYKDSEKAELWHAECDLMLHGAAVPV